MLFRLALSRAASTCPGSTFASSSSRGLNFARRGYAAAPEVHFTEREQSAAQLLAAVKTKVDECYAARKAAEEDMGGTDAAAVAAQIARSKTLKELAPLADAYEKYTGVRQALIDVDPMLDDPDPSLREMFESEHDSLLEELDAALDLLPDLLLPPSETAHLPAIMTLNAGVGGSEAALFVEEMSRTYQRFAEKRGWKTEIMSSSEGAGSKGGGGLREITMKFEPPPYGGEDSELYGLVKWERGVHRVQRIPQTETQGRVHTSTIAAIVMPIYPDVPEAPLVDPKDVKTEVMRSRGAGGQHVNKTESAVRLTHIPTGISVSMQDSRSQHQNRAWAWDILRARLSERKFQEEAEAKRASRKSQVKSLDRSDKIRTYNFPQDRLTDHRIHFSTTGLKEILDGDGLEYVIDELRRDLNKRRMESILAGDEDFDE